MNMKPVVSKKLPCVLVTALLMLTMTVFPVYAEDSLKNVTVDSAGNVSWSAWPGADQYFFEVVHDEIPTSYMLGTETGINLEDWFDQVKAEYPSVLTGGEYQYRISAYKDGERIASYTGKYAYHYTPPAPLEASVSSDGILTWKAYPGAVSYDYGTDDQMVIHEGAQLKADLKVFIDKMISVGKAKNTGSHTVTLIARDAMGHELQRWEGTCSYKAAHSVSEVRIVLLPDSFNETGKAITPKPVLEFQNSQLIEGTDYTLSYKNNIYPGTASVTITGKGIYSGTKTLSFQIVGTEKAAGGTDPSGAETDAGSPDQNSSRKATDLSTLTVTAADQTYNGKARKPVPVFRSGKKKLSLTAGKDYTLSYKNNKKIGTAALTVTGKGNYTGRKTVPFQILPKGTSLKKLTAEETQITVTWKKQKKQVTGYRIQYSLKKNFKNAKTVTVKKAATGKKKLKKLKSGKRYYVRICTYKKAGKKNYCSAWSKVLKIKTKKPGQGD